MTVSDEIHQRLRAAFHPDRLEVIDESESHRGHAGFQEGGESHFHVVIQASSFAALSRLARHRAVHQALGKDLMTRFHALSLDISG